MAKGRRRDLFIHAKKIVGVDDDTVTVGIEPIENDFDVIYVQPIN